VTARVLLVHDEADGPANGALADLLAAWVRVEIERLGATPSVVAGRTGYDPIQEYDALTCPMAEPEAPSGGTHEKP
jgi:hypothetical protein